MPNIPSTQVDIIADLEYRYKDQSVRFNSGFMGSVPVQATGRVGRRYFYFRFRYDHASLTVGSPDRRQNASYNRIMSTRSRRALRRGVGTDFDRYLHGMNLRRSRIDVLSDHPSRVLRYAATGPVTGERYAGTLESAQAADLFVQLFDRLEPVATKPGRRKIFKRSYTPPFPAHRHVITKKKR